MAVDIFANYSYKIISQTNSNNFLKVRVLYIRSRQSALGGATYPETRQLQNLQSTLRNHLKAYDRGDKREDEEETPEGGGLAEDKDADKHRTYCADTSPYGVGSA